MLELIPIIFWSLFFILAGFYSVYFILMIVSARKSRSILKPSITPSLSLVIPVHNESKGIIRKLENSVCLDYPRDKLEIIVVDDCSSDDTYQLVKNFVNDFSGQTKISLLSLDKWSGKASALNHAWTHCTGEIVAMTDADIILEKDALQKIVRNFGNKQVGAVTGRLRVAENSSNSTSASEKNYRSIFDIIRLGESYIDSTPIFNGLIMAFRRELLGRLDSDIIADDTELAMFSREKGWRAIYDPEVVAYEFISESKKERAKQKMRRGRGIVQSFLRHKKILFNPKFSKYGLIIFPSEFFMHIVSPILLLLTIGTLIPLIAIYSLLIPTNILLYVLAFVALSICGLVLFLILRTKVFHSEKNVVNPFSVFLSFLTHEFYLVAVLFSYTLRSLHIKKKKEDIRSAWQTKTS